MGVVLFVFLCGRLPFKSKDMASLFHAILAGEFKIPENLSPDASDLLRSMLERDTEARITIEGIFHHPWVCRNNWKYEEHNAVPVIENIDQDIAEKLETCGFSVPQVLESLRNKQLNQATATYNLLAKQPKPQFQVSRTRSEMLSKYVTGSSSTPVSAVNTPNVSQNASPSQTPHGVSPAGSPESLFNQTPHEESFNTLQRRRIAQARKTRGHKRTRSDLPVEIVVEDMPDVESSLSVKGEPVKRAQSESIDLAPDSPLRAPAPATDVISIPEPLPPPEEERVKEEKPENLGKEEETSWVMMAPRTRGHRRYKSEHRMDRMISISAERKAAEPATESLWSSVSSLPTNEEEPVRRLTEQEALTWKATEESERKQITGSSDEYQKPFNSFLSWTKKMLSLKQAEQNQPRECRTSFSSSTTSRKHPREILLEVKRVLDLLGIEFEHNSPYCLKAHCPAQNIQFEVEVCIPPNLTEIYVIRLRRISGDWIHYKDKCQAVLETLEI